MICGRSWMEEITGIKSFRGGMGMGSRIWSRGCSFQSPKDLPMVHFPLSFTTVSLSTSALPGLLLIDLLLFISLMMFIIGIETGH